MSWNQGSYGVQHRGATGGYAGPARLTQGLVGANRPTDGLSVRPLAPVHSLAASLPPESLAAIASDKPHSSVLDGHAGSAVAKRDPRPGPKRCAAETEARLFLLSVA